MKNNIKLFRTQFKLTQEDVAKKTGVTRQTINAIEKGEYNPTIKLCLKLCWALDARLDELFWEEEKNEED